MSDTKKTAPETAPLKRSALRADIQALRAVAVLFVVVNHIWPMRLSGGYVGVDVFFVISGYLITAHLLREIRVSDRVALPRFYARRAKRLLPAALLVGVVTLIATVIWVPAERWARIAQEIFASAAYVENWVLTASSVNYSARGQASTPAQHYWSLSVEEQFYLLWPLTLLIIGTIVARKLPGRITARPGALVAAISLICAASFAFSVWQTETDRAAAYFNTFGRAWEFMLGALVAAAAPFITRWFATHPLLSLRGIVQLASYAAILWSGLRFTESTAFPGPWALLPVAATALIIATGPEVPKWSPVRWQAWRPVQYLGDISYSLYLWHWPIIVIVPFALAREVQTVDRVAMFAASIVLAALSKHFIEDPGRTKLFATSKPRMPLITAGASIAVVGALALGTVTWAGAVAAREAARIDAAVGSGCFAAAALANDGCDDPFGPAIFPAGADSEAPWKASARECEIVPDSEQIMVKGKPSLVHCDFTKGVPASGAPGSADAPKSVWLVGDSHAEHWRAALFDIGRANGWDLTTTMQGSCATVPATLAKTFGTATTDEKKQSCGDWVEAFSSRLAQAKPDLVIVSNFASTEEIDDGSGRPQPEQYADAMRKSFSKWTAAGSRVVVIRDVPTAGKTLGADCVAQRGTQDQACTASEKAMLRPDPQGAAVPLLDDPRVHLVDLTEYFCRDGVCSGVIGGLPVYYDQDHVSASYSRSLAPMIGAKLSTALDVTLSAPVAGEE